jgi:hypothetical protein
MQLKFCAEEKPDLQLEDYHDPGRESYRPEDWSPWGLEEDK